MKKLLLCLFLSACAAALLTTFQWERTARQEWKEFAVASQSDF
jgi:hypothetical protein